MTPFAHAESSAKKWGGDPNDYIEIHNWLDETKQFTGDWTHRALRHHAAGIEWVIEKFGHYLSNINGKYIPIKMIAERHIQEDCGFIPTAQDWLKQIEPKPWMLRVAKKSTQPMEIADDN